MRIKINELPQIADNKMSFKKFFVDILSNLSKNLMITDHFTLNIILKFSGLFLHYKLQ